MSTTTQYVAGLVQSPPPLPDRFARPEDITSATVLHIDNRPGQVDGYERRIREAERVAFTHRLKPGRLPGRGVPREFAADPDLFNRISDGLRQGNFRDTTSLAGWLQVVNQYANFPGCGLPPLRLLVAHADTQINQIHHAIVMQGRRPAAVILSGSPKMLTEVHDTPVIEHTLLLILHLLEERIPLLGICFGAQLMGYTAYGAMVEWLTVPGGKYYEFHRRLKRFSPRLIPGNKRMIIGSRKITRLPNCLHPAMNQVNGVAALKLHSQGFLWDQCAIPPDKILATSERDFTPKNRGMRYLEGLTSQRLVEVFSAGRYALATQLHPELRRDLILVYSYFPDFAAWLEGEGYDLDLLRQELSLHPDSPFEAGQRLGYNFTKRVAALLYVIRAVQHRLISYEQAQLLLWRMMKRNAQERQLPTDAELSPEEILAYWGSAIAEEL